MTHNRKAIAAGTWLTPRERQIAAAVAAGLTNREIGLRLGVREKTVRNQLTVLFEKLHVQGRLQLGLFVTQHPEALGEDL